MSQPSESAIKGSAIGGRTIGLVGRSLWQYLLSLIVTDALLGVAVWLTFRLFGVHYAAAFGLAAAILHFVPVLGPTVLAVASFTFVAIQFDSLLRGLLLGGLTIVLAGLIGVILQVWLSAKGARMNFTATFLSAIFWVWVWGLPGLVFGTPITIALKTLCSQIPSLRWVDTLMSARPHNGAASDPAALTQVTPKTDRRF
jgi:predicted PurR-regulated permease PerM